MDYKEKLELAKDWYNDQSTTNKEKLLLEKLFPELKDSEDERIRKTLIDFVEQYGDNYYGQIAKASAISWLEKQGEQQSYRGNADIMRKNLIKAFKSVGGKRWGGFDVRDIIHFLESKDAIELGKQGENKPVTIDIDKMVDDYANNNEPDNQEFGKPVNCMIRAYRQGLNDAIRKVMTKPTWSDDDEKMMQFILKYINASASNFDLGNIQIWFRNIKKRMKGE